MNSYPLETDIEIYTRKIILYIHELIPIKGQELNVAFRKLGLNPICNAYSYGPPFKYSMSMSMGGYIIHEYSLNLNIVYYIHYIFGVFRIGYIGLVLAKAENFP